MVAFCLNTVIMQNAFVMFSSSFVVIIYFFTHSWTAGDRKQEMYRQDFRLFLTTLHIKNISKLGDSLSYDPQGSSMEFQGGPQLNDS